VISAEHVVTIVARPSRNRLPVSEHIFDVKPTVAFLAKAL
jgi:hypothetical protein